VHVCGVDTDQCVLATVLTAFDAGLEPVVLADLCLSCAGEAPHEAGLVALRRAIGEDHVVRAEEALRRCRRDSNQA
jgi:nicotinamidase-related amidase